MRALTVRQPWAGAIFHGKDIENRPGALTYRGPLAIHAGQHLSHPDSFAEVENLAGVEVPVFGSPRAGAEWTLGAVVGIVRLAGAHRWSDCQGSCSPWAQRGRAHLQLEDAQPLKRALPALGKQTLWTPDADLLAQIRRQAS